MLVRKFEKWHAGPSGTPVYDGVNGKLVGAFPAGYELHTGGESLDGNWRLVERSGTAGVNPQWVYCKRSDIVPETQGGDTAYDARVAAAIAS